MPWLRRFALVCCLASGWASAARAQTYVFGGPGSVEGKFETEQGGFDDQGWLDVDCSPADQYWQVSTLYAENLNSHGSGNHALWAGQTAAQQPTWANAPGYGNQWLAAAEWSAPVPDPNTAVEVSVSFYYNLDTEDTYDFLMLDWHDGIVWQTLLNVSGSTKTAGSFDAPGEFFTTQWSVSPSQFVGPNHDRIRLRLFVRSDGGVSDEDGLLGFDFDGAAQVDDIVVRFDGIEVDGGGDADGVATFESGDDEGWTPKASPCQCAIFSELPPEYDPQGTNSTPILGRILDTSVRLAGRCRFTSPTIDWSTPSLLDGSFLEFDSFFESTGNPGSTQYQIEMTWRVAGVWQPPEVVFVGDVPATGWQTIHVDLGGIAPVSADACAMAIDTGFGDGLRDIVAIDNVTLVRFDTAVAAPSALAGDRLSVWPNPANPRTTVGFSVDRAVQVALVVYDLRGRRVRELWNRRVGAGDYEVPLDGRDDSGRSLASGTYFVRLETPYLTRSTRFTLVE